MSTAHWSDIRDKHIEAIGREDVARGSSRLISQVRAHRLADMRKRCNLTKSPRQWGQPSDELARSRTENFPASTFSTATSPPSEASSKLSLTSETNNSGWLSTGIEENEDAHNFGDGAR
jgi:hypothetical protein